MLPTPPRAGTELVLARDEQPLQLLSPMPEQMAEEEGATISLAQILAILGAYWKVSLALFLVVVALAAVVTKMMPKRYTATATLLTSFDRTDPLAARDPAEGYATYVNSFLPTQIELMQSPEVLDEVIAKLNLTALPEFAAGNRGGAATLRDWVESGLRSKISIAPGLAGSQFLYVGATASRSDLAADIANGIVDVYVSQLNANANVPSMERAERYAEELEDLKKKVQAAQDAYTRFRTSSGAIDIDAKNSDVESDLLSTLEHRLLDARNALQANQARAGERGEPTTAFLASTTVVSLREEASKLAARMAQLRTSLGPNHPEVIALQSQIEANKAALQAAMSTYSRANSSDMAISGSEVASLEQAVAAQRAKVLQSKLRRDEAAKYQLELESAQTVYKRALDGYDQTKFAATSQGPNVRVASRARPPVKADHPNPIKNMLMGLGAGLALALLVPFVLELPRRKIRCRNDLEKSLGIPVLAELQSLNMVVARQAS